MLELIAGAALIAVLFIYGTLRGMQSTLQRLETHLSNSRPVASPASSTAANVGYGYPGPRAEAERQAAAQQAAARSAAAQQAAARETAARQAALEREAERQRAVDPVRAAAEDAAARRRAADASHAAATPSLDPQQIAERRAADAFSEAERVAARREAMQRAASQPESPESLERVRILEEARRTEAVRQEALRREALRRQAYERQQAAAGAAAPTAPAPTAPATRRGIDWELFAGGRLFNIVGALVLIIGVGLLFKYLFDQNVISVGLRIAGGVALGGAIVGAGHIVRSRSKRTWFADGIVGTGFGTLYLSGYASFQSYHVFSFQEAYGYMSVVTLVAFALGLRYDSMWISLIGWAGGFLTPFVLGDARQNELGLASYLIVLDLGMTAIAVVKKRWFAMQPLAMAATYLGALVWYAQNAADIDWFVSVIALVSFWLIFFAASIANTLRTKAFSGVDVSVAAFNGLLFISYLFVAVGTHRGAFETGLAFVAVAYAAGYAAIVRRCPEVEPLRIQYAIGTAVFALVSTVSHYHATASELASALALESIVTLAIAKMLRRDVGSRAARELLSVGFTILGIAWTTQFTSVLAAGERARWDLHPGGPDLAAILLIVATFAAERLYAPDRLVDGLANPLLRIVGVIGSCSLVVTHTHDPYSLTLSFAPIALALGWIGTSKKLIDLEVGGLILLAISHLLYWTDLETYGFVHANAFSPVANERFCSLAVLTATTAMFGELLRRRGEVNRELGRWMRLLAAIAFTVGTSFEVHDGFQIALARLEAAPHTATAIAAIGRVVGGEPLAIMGLWVAISIVMLGLGVRLRNREFRIYAIGVFDLTILKAFFDLQALANPYKIFAFIGLGITLLGVSALYSRLEQGFFGRSGIDRMGGASGEPGMPEGKAASAST